MQQARIALVQAQAARFADTAALFQALGGGWWNRTDVEPSREHRRSGRAATTDLVAGAHGMRRSRRQ